MSEVLTNEQRYKTPKERGKAFTEWCCCHSSCRTCEIDKFTHDSKGEGCLFYWLALEADEEKPEPCPFCGKEVVVGFSENIHKEKYRQVWCSDGERCGYECVMKKTEEEAIAAHNRVCRAVEAVKKGDVK